MTTEELKIRITADAGAAAAGIKSVKDELNGMGDAAFGANKKTNLGMRELQYNIEQVRSLQFADIFIGQFDKISAQITKTKALWLATTSAFGSAVREATPAIKFFFSQFDHNAMKQMNGESWRLRDTLKGLFDVRSWKTEGGVVALQRLKAGFAGLRLTVKSLGDTITTAFGGPAMIAILKFMAAVALLVGTIKMATSAAQRLNAEFYEAQKIGMDIATYQEWAYIMSKVGVESDKLADFIKGLSAAQNDLRDGTEAMVDAFAALGLSAEEAAGMTQEQLFSETVKRLQQVESQVERTSLAYRIFGEDDAAQLNNVLNLNNQEMERMIENFYLLGGSASDNAVQKSRIYASSVSNLKLAWEGFANSLGEVILPIMTKIVDALTKAVVAVNLFIRTVFGFDLVSKGTKSTIEGTSISIDGYTGSLDAATDAAEKLKRTTQSFDELNVVSNPNSKSGSGGGSSGGGGSAIDIPTIDYEGLTKDLGLSEMTEWFKTNAEEIKKWTAVVGGATAAWELFRLGFFLFTGEKLGFFTGLGTILVKIGGWLGAVIGLLKEGNSIWAVLAVAFPKIAAAVTAVGKAFAVVGGWIAAAAKAVGAFIAGLSGTALAVIAAIIAAVAAAVYFLVQNWEAMGQVVKDFFAQEIAPKLEKIGELFGYMGQALYSIWDALAGLGIAIWEAFPEAVQEFIIGFGLTIRDIALAIWDVIVAIGEWIVSVDWLYWIGEVIEWLGGIVVAILGGVIGGAIDGVMSAIQGIVTFITGVVQIISGLIGGLINLIVALFTGDLQKAFDSVMLICMGILNLFVGLYDATIGVVVEFVKGIIAWFVEMWDELVGHSIVPDMIEAIIMWFFKLPGELIGMIAGFVEDIISWFINLAVRAGECASDMWYKIKQPFGEVLTWFKRIFTQAWDSVKGVFRNVGSWFKTNVVDPITRVFTNIGSKIGDAVKDTFSKAINTVLKTAVNIINGFISAINVAIDVINAIPGVSIDNLDKLDVPELATGGILTGDTIFRGGEGGKREAVLPLEQNTGWMDILADRIAARSSAPTKIVLQVGEKELGWASINSINGITKQTGGLQLQLV